MSSHELRKRFLDFFAARGHAVVASSSLLPDDLSVLLTSAGMQQFKKYYTGEADPMKDFGSKNTASIQKSFRTSDIDEVGDASHLTFFEMLGNFSFGGYFKEEAIRAAHEFITQKMQLPIAYVTIFRGNEIVPRDEESIRAWKALGVEDIREEGIEDVFWGPTGASGPCGPTTEIYCKNAAGKDIELWNIVFNEYLCEGSREAFLRGEARLSPLGVKGVDTGMGLERLAMVVQQKRNIFETDLFEPILSSIIEILGDKPIEKVRLIADHLRAVAFIIADGIIPGKDERNYIPRRLIRDAMTAHYLYIGASLDVNFFINPVNTIVNLYKKQYPYLQEKYEEIISVIRKEAENFAKVLRLIGNISDLEKQYARFSSEKNWPDARPGTTLDLYGKALFDIRQSTGASLPQMKMVMEKEGLKLSDKTLREYDKAYEEAQDISRIGSEKKFGGHGLILDTGELKAANEEELKKVTRLHTATHVLQAALRATLGSAVHQMGSDITVERLRFDFTFPRKVTPEELNAVEELVNQKIKENSPVNMVEMPIEDAKAFGALTVERAKYAPVVKVYSIENFSKEVCGGPHVERTRQIGKFTIIKEEASSAGVRRIRARVE